MTLVYTVTTARQHDTTAASSDQSGFALQAPAGSTSINGVPAISRRWVAALERNAGEALENFAHMLQRHRRSVVKPGPA